MSALKNIGPWLPWMTTIFFAALAFVLWQRPPREIEVERVVEKVVTVDKVVYVDVVRVEKRDVVRTVRVTSPDGTVREETETDRTTVGEAAKVVERVAFKDKTVEKEVIKDRPVRNDWHVGVGVSSPLALPLTPTYSITVDRRIIGPVWLGIEARSDFRRPAELGARLSVTF